MEPIERITQQNEEILAALHKLTLAVPILRKPLAPKVKELHCQVTAQRRNGICPCCQDAPVVAADESPMPGAEYDHWFGRHRAGADETWLVCGPCNDRLNESAFKSGKHAEFSAYRHAVRMFQLSSALDYQGDLFTLEQAA